MLVHLVFSCYAVEISQCGITNKLLNIVGGKITKTPYCYSTTRIYWHVENKRVARPTCVKLAEHHQNPHLLPTGAGRGHGEENKTRPIKHHTIVETYIHDLTNSVPC